jgi:hypothetical protein
MKNWKDIPVPPLMRDLPRDERGFPVPFIVLRDPSGKAVFSANDTLVVDRCHVEQRCGVCGNQLDDMWVLGGPVSAFHPNGVYIDTPIHHECGTYALQVCPYLVIAAYHSIPDREKKLTEKFGGTRLFANPTQDPPSPKFPVTDADGKPLKMVKAKNGRMVPSPTKIFQRHSSETRANLAASFRLGYRQREAVGVFFWIHPWFPNIAFDTRKSAIERAAMMTD